jgi:2,3-bisphosphoglycerate-independent phosphoglycerate mutase
MIPQNPIALVILDGFGFSKQKPYNAIYSAKTPFLNKVFKDYPHTLLNASGQAVGLPQGYVGNSEVGHMTIGCGRIVQQEVTTINNAINDETFFTNEILINNLAQLKKSGGALHLMGLLSDTGIHSHEKHLYAFIKAAQQAKIEKLYLHLFLDGRDIAPQSATIYLTRLEKFLHTINFGTIGTIQGRFFGMDRDTNWERTQASYTALTGPIQLQFNSWPEALN